MTIVGVRLPSGTLEEKVQALVQDKDGKLSNADWANAVEGALKKYSWARPLKKVIDLMGNGTNDIDPPASWVPEFSEIKSIEYPAGNVPPDMLDNDDYAKYVSPSGEKIRILSTKPPATDTLRVKFTIIRTEDTIAANDMDAVANLAASIALGMLSSRYIGKGDSTIGADGVNYRTKSQEAAARAKVCLAFYNDHIGVDEEGGTPAASAVADLDLGYPGGSDRLTHPRRGRRLR